MSTQTAFSDSKRHYEILDGLRGVAAITVVVFHVLEIFSGGSHLKMMINHGYLAVDFFFVLSGFVIGYAYDDRWNNLSLKEFFKRRLIRLHPMIIIGMLVGAIAFYFTASPDLFPNVAQTPVWKLIVIMLIGFTLIPVPVSMDIRGWWEMHPLNGPAWTLFFEYVANILYALFIRKFSNTALFILVLVSGVALAHFSITGPNGDVIGGWSFNVEQLKIGFTRLMYPFFAGLLLSRVFKPMRINNAFIWCSLLLLVVLSIPRVGGEDRLWLNGIYDAATIIFIFPLIVYLGASGEIKNKITGSICKFLGDISYPIYITHFPLAYIFYAWVVNNKVPLEEAWPYGAVVVVASIALAYASLKLYDIPVRKWLMANYVRR